MITFTGGESYNGNEVAQKTLARCDATDRGGLSYAPGSLTLTPEASNSIAVWHLRFRTICPKCASPCFVVPLVVADRRPREQRRGQHVRTTASLPQLDHRDKKRYMHVILFIDGLHVIFKLASGSPASHDYILRNRQRNRKPRLCSIMRSMSVHIAACARAGFP